MAFFEEDPASLYQSLLAQRAGGVTRRFDEYYRCYPLSMMPGPDRNELNHGGKVFLPVSALEKLTRLHITYPMLFELINGRKERVTHAGVLEFTAEEGKIYLPLWLMQTLLLESGDLLQIKSTDLPPGSFIKLQPQSPSFLDITDPKAVLENAFRNFSCLTVGDIFSFAYNDSIYEIEVLEVKPDTPNHAICTLETDLSVDFAEPVGYKEQLKAQAAANPKGSTGAAVAAGGKIHTQGTMAQAINYSAIAPWSGAVAAGEQAASTYFSGSGQRLGNKRTKNAASQSNNSPAALPAAAPRPNRSNGPQPLRLPPGKLFFGYEYVPPRKDREQGQQQVQKTFTGKGQNLRGKVVDASAEQLAVPEDKPKPGEGGGRTLRDMKR